MNRLKFSIQSSDDRTMSNWQISYMIEALTEVNNKFVVLKSINSLLEQGIQRENIFVFDKSFDFKAGYKTYFDNGSVFNTLIENVYKLSGLGRLVPMAHNQKMVEMNCLFDAFRNINRALYDSLKIRMTQSHLEKAIMALEKDGDEEAYNYLRNAGADLVDRTFEKRLIPDYSMRNKCLERVSAIVKNDNILSLKDNYNGYSFYRYFNRLERPVAGYFDEKTNSFIIINADQMYKNGEDAKGGIELKQISRNSPVLMVVIVTGIMLSVLKYLSDRSNDVAGNMKDNTSFDELAANEYGTANKEIKELAVDHMNKIEAVLTGSNVRYTDEQNEE